MKFLQILKICKKSVPYHALHGIQCPSWRILNSSTELIFQIFQDGNDIRVSLERSTFHFFLKTKVFENYLKTSEKKLFLNYRDNEESYIQQLIEPLSLRELMYELGAVKSLKIRFRKILPDVEELLSNKVFDILEETQTFEYLEIQANPDVCQKIFYKLS